MARVQNLVPIDITPLYDMGILNSTSFASAIIEKLRVLDCVDVVAWYSCADYCTLLEPSIRLHGVLAHEADRIEAKRFREILAKHGIRYDNERDEWLEIPENYVVIEICDGYGKDVIVLRRIREECREIYDVVGVWRSGNSNVVTLKTIPSGKHVARYVIEPGRRECFEAID